LIVGAGLGGQLLGPLGICLMDADLGHQRACAGLDVVDFVEKPGAIRLESTGRVGKVDEHRFELRDHLFGVKRFWFGGWGMWVSATRPDDCDERENHGAHVGSDVVDCFLVIPGNTTATPFAVVITTSSRPSPSRSPMSRFAIASASSGDSASSGC